MENKLIPDLEQTQTMIDMLEPNSGIITFQTFDDNADIKHRNLACQYHGDIITHAKELERLNKRGGGVFVAVNETDGHGRTASNITAVRALFVDFDTADADRIGRLVNSPVLPPSLIVESSPDKHHAYWITEGIALDKFKQYQQMLIAYFASIGDEPDKAVHDLPRVMRLAGFYHQKVKADKGQTGEPFQTRIAYIGKRYELSRIEKWLATMADLPAQPNTEQARESKQHTQQTSAPILTHIFDDSELPQLSAERVRALARGRWQAILSQLDYSVSSDIKEHTTCPVCGGLDRFRFDDEHGSGSFICSQGTGEVMAGDGLSLLADHAGIGIHQAISAVTSVLDLMGLISPYDDKTKPESFEWGQPDPLAHDPSKPTPYPIQAWNGLLRGVVESIAHHAQVPDAMAGQCVLGALAHIGQAYIDAPMGHKHMPASLYLITEGESGSGKSTAMTLSHYEIRAYERAQYDGYLLALTQWESDKAALKGKELQDFLANNPRPHNPITVFGDATIEPILDKFINGEMINASWTTDEAAQFFNGYTMKGDTAGSALSALTTLYSDGVITRTRSQKSQYANPRSQAYDVRMTLLLMGQRIVLEQALTDPMMNGQGFLARALIACPESLQGQRIWNDPQRRQQSPYDDTHLIAYWSRCKSLLNVSLTDAVQADLAFDGRIKIGWQDAQTEQAFYDGMQAIEERQAKGSPLESIKSYASRMAENASRIASLMAFFNDRQAINIDDINRAFMLVEYSTAERLRYCDASPTGEQNDSEKLSTWLVDKARAKQPPKLNRTYVYNGAPKPMRKNNRLLQNELDMLESAGHIRQETEGKKQVIYINPHLYP
jgi:hypothetical protein